MRSVKFPNIFKTNSTNVWKSSEYLEATKQNTTLLLNTERNKLYGDPYFGLLVKHYLFDQNDYVLKDILIDMIYTQVAIFIPQINIKRTGIDVVQDEEKGKIFIKIRGTNQIDYQLETINLALLTNDNK